MEKTFAEFKEQFYSKVKDLTIFDSGEYNLLKVVLDGLKVDYASKGKIRVFIFYPSIIRKLFLFFGKMKSVVSGLENPFTDEALEALKNKSKRQILIIDPAGRVVKIQLGNISFYFGNIIKALKPENVVTIVEGPRPNFPENDFHVKEYNSRLAVACGWNGKANQELLNSIRVTYDKIVEDSVFSELEKLNIRIALQQFFIQAVFWRKVLSVINPEMVFLWPHYHREGCILAFREKKIPVIEIQHGLIAEEDVFYTFPKQVEAIEKRALFADEIWVYGNFWKDQLTKGAGYASKQVKVCGYFPITIIPTDEIKESYRAIFPEKKIMLVTTQTFMHDYFCSYIKFLSEDLRSRNLPYAVFVKLHPAENLDRYDSILNLDNVRIVNENLDVLFSVVDIHISVYSTTLFDAIRFGIPNFSVYFQPFSDYIELIRKENIAHMIHPNENPIDFSLTPSYGKPKEYYYKEFDSSFFENIVS